MFRGAAGGLLLAGLVGCSTDAETSPEVLVTDSAGVRIVESFKPAWERETPWDIEFAPVLDLATAGEGEDYEFDYVNSALRMEDGRIAVVDDGLHEVRFYGEEGKFLKRVGREGEGPREFKSPKGIQGFRGDSLVVFDPMLRRITVFGPDLNIARVTVLSGTDLGVEEVFVFSDSTFLSPFYSYSYLPAQGQGYYRMPYLIAVMGPDAEDVDTIATVPGFEGFLHERGDARPWFTRVSQVATRADEVIVGTSDHLEFWVLDRTGALRTIVRVPDYDLSISDSIFDLELESLAPLEAPPYYRTLAERMPVPENRPGYGSLIVDAEGYVWAGEYKNRITYHDATDWEVFAPDGVWMGELTTPPRFRVLSIGTDHILGVWMDDLDVHHVQLLPLARHQAGEPRELLGTQQSSNMGTNSLPGPQGDA